jgi:hypothetical protein
MFPEQHHQPTPSAPQPQRSFTPQAPHYGYNANPQVPPQPQHNPTGQYEVLPPLPGVQNNGHTGHNPYEFIVNPNTPKRRSSLFGGDAFLTRIALIAGGAVVLMIIAGVIISALGPKSITPSMLAIAQRQQEIIRISTDAYTKASSDDAKNFTTNVEASVTSSQQQTLTYLAGHGMKKVSPKVLALDQDAQADATLASAITAGTYDTAVVQNLTGQLQAYEQLLQTTFKQTTSKTTRQILQTDFTAANLLLEQAKALTSASS